MCLVLALSNAAGQQLAPTPSTSPSATPPEEVSQPALDEEIVPTFETQKLARTYILDIPAPRGQITDRNGAPLAQNRLSYNLAMNFPTPLEFGGDLGGGALLGSSCRPVGVPSSW